MGGFNQGVPFPRLTFGPVVFSALCALAQISSMDAAEEMYPGVEAGAPWRVAALERIERLRKADLTVRVVDGAGKPVKDAEVAVRQQRHAFRFSCDVDPALLSDSAGPSSGDEKEKYRQMVMALFNVIHPTTASLPEVSEKAQEWARGHGFLEPNLREATTEVPAQFEREDLIPPPALEEILGELAGKGRPLRALHYQLSVDPSDAEGLQLQAAYTRDYLTLLFSRPEVIEIGLAGLWVSSDGERWALFESDWTPRAVGDTYLRLVKKQWWTEDTALTNAAGECTIRAFLGDYRVSVSSGGKMFTSNVVVPQEKGRLEITLGPAASVPSSAETSQ